MGIIAKCIDSVKEKFVTVTGETHKGFNRKGVLYTPIGEDSVPCKDDRILMVKIEGTGRYVVVGSLNVSQGAKPGEKILYSRNADGDVKAVVKLLEDGKMKFNASDDIEIDSEKKIKIKGGGKKAARKGDKVKVQIPAGSVIVSVAGQATGTLNPNSIECEGTIEAGSDDVEIG